MSAVRLAMRLPRRPVISLRPLYTPTVQPGLTPGGPPARRGAATAAVARPPAKSTRKHLKAHPSSVARSSLQTAHLRRRPSPSRARTPRRREPLRLVLPDMGLSSAQLAALADWSERDILKSARQLDESVHDASTIIPPAVIELVAEELALPIDFQPHNLPLLPDDTSQAAKNENDVAVPNNGPIVRRVPVITVMGHVDHGKTSLLDALRSSDVAKHEHGGITQSVAAFHVNLSRAGADAAISSATFIDTPGHAAFSAMRANGTVATDIVILVVAADDGVMPQTIEAAQLARAANVPVIVAVNKSDLPGADSDRVRYQLLRELDINSEQLGGDVQCVDISAKTGDGLPDLLDAIALQSDMLDLRARAQAVGSGICLESRLDRALGSVATVVLREGSLQKGDFLAFQSSRAMSGDLYGKVRILLGSDGQQKGKAEAGDAIGIVGIREPIPPGAEVCVMKNEKAARAKSAAIIARNIEAIGTIQRADAQIQDNAERKAREAAEKATMAGEQVPTQKANEDAESAELPDDEGRKRKLLVVVKGDVKGSADAVAQCLRRLGSPNLPVQVLSVGIGEVNETDLRLAGAAVSQKGCIDKSVIVGFNVKVKDVVQKSSKRQRVDIVSHSIIYLLEDEVRERLDVIRKMDEKIERVVGEASVVRVFEEGVIAGCLVDSGAVATGETVKVLRFPDSTEGSRVREEVFRGEVASIKHFAKDVKSISKGNECGISVQGWSTFKAGDQVVSVTVE